MIFKAERKGHILTITAPIIVWLRRDEPRFGDELQEIISEASGEYIDELQNNVTKGE